MLISGERRTAHFRAHERRSAHLQGSIWHAGGAESAAAEVLNLGLGGAGVVCKAVLRADDRVMLTLQAESLLDPLVLAARVAWVLPVAGRGSRNAGLCFESPDRSALLTLFQLIGTFTA